MIRKEDFIHAMGAPDEGFDRAVDAALRQVRESEERPVMKRKLTLTLLAAAAVLALTGAALAVGLNLFDYFGRHDQRLRAIEPDTNAETQGPVKMESEAMGASIAEINNAYYDGQSLIVTYTQENYRCYDYFTPTEAELSNMREDPDFFLEYRESDPDQIEYTEAFDQAVRAKKSFGLVEYCVSPADHWYTDDGVDLPPYCETEEAQADGLLYSYREFETPLPASVRNRDSLTLRIPFRLYTSWYYFDGEKYYTKYAQEPLAELTATVKRAEAVTRNYAWEGELDGVPAKVEAQVSAVHAYLRIEMANGMLPDPATLVPEDAAILDDIWVRYALFDESGREFRISSSGEAEGVTEIEYEGIGCVPDALTLTISVDGEGEWDADQYVMPGTPIVLKPE